MNHNEQNHHRNIAPCGLGSLLRKSHPALLAGAMSLLAFSNASAFTPAAGQTYTLESRGNNGMVLAGEKLWSGNPLAVSMHHFCERTRQLWRFESLGGGYYKVICAASPAGEVLTMYQPPKQGKKFPPRYADTLAWTGSTAQQWQLVNLGGGWVGHVRRLLVGQHRGRAGNAAQRFRPTQRQYHHLRAHRWKFHTDQGLV